MSNYRLVTHTSTELVGYIALGVHIITCNECENACTGIAHRKSTCISITYCL